MAIADLGGIRSASTSFVGRRDELARLRVLLAASRLLTITGPGGSGKTRLAEELVAAVSRAFGPGIAIAYLAGVGEATEVGEVVMAAVGLRGAGDPHLALAEYLGSRPFLLVLDNCEHVRGAAAQLAIDLHRACPGVVVLATSRRPLAVPGEQLFPIEGLSESAALTLFTDRVRLAAPSFVLSEAQRPLVAGVCARLDGMPLAIELAAARLRHLGLAELAHRLAGRLGDLGSDDSLAPARQRSLRGAIDWSTDLLDEPQRILWRRLSIFAEGFRLQAAEAVAAFAPIDPVDVERLLGELVDRSMVVFDVERGRYRLIEAMREYTRERLLEAGEGPLVAERHRSWMLDRALELERRWWGPDQASLLDAMSEEAGNLRAALESARAVGVDDVGLRIATASWWYWMTRASHVEAARWFVPFLEQTTDPTLGARANAFAGWIAILSGRPDRCRTFLARAEALLGRATDPRVASYVRIVTSFLEIAEGGFDRAAVLAEEVLADADADPVCRSWARIELGVVNFFKVDLPACLRVSGEAIAECLEVGESWTRVPHLHLQATVARAQGDPERASVLLLEALRIDRRLDDIWHRAWSIEALAWVAADLGQDTRAARLLGIAAACWAFTGSSIAGPWQVYRDATRAMLRRRLGEARLVREIEAGRSLDQVHALAYALDDAPEASTSAVAPLSAAIRVSPRELEVAALVAGGLANREIGERLFLSPRTVETHVQHLMDKLGVGSRAEIAAWHSRHDIRTETR